MALLGAIAVVAAAGMAATLLAARWASRVGELKFRRLVGCIRITFLQAGLSLEISDAMAIMREP